MKAINIHWNVDNDEDMELLPTEVELPAGMTDEEEICDYLSNLTGFCHEGFTLSSEPPVENAGRESQSIESNTFDIGSRRISFDQLKSKDELMNWLVENGATHTELMDFCENYSNEYQNELCWHYPISDGKHLGTFLVLVKEGILSLPYDEAVKEDYEVFTLEDACLFSKSSDMGDFISDWDSFSNDLRNTMLAMFHYLQRTEGKQNA